MGAGPGPGQVPPPGGGRPSNPLLVVLVILLVAGVVGVGALLVAGGDDGAGGTASEATPDGPAEADPGPEGDSTGAGEVPDVTADDGTSGSGAAEGPEPLSPAEEAAGTPDGAVDQFITSGRAADCPSLIEITTPGFFGGTTDEERLAECQDVATMLQDLTVTMERTGPAAVDGATATVTVTGAGTESTLTLVLEDGVWKIDQAEAA